MYNEYIVPYENSEINLISNFIKYLFLCKRYQYYSKQVIKERLLLVNKAKDTIVTLSRDIHEAPIEGHTARVEQPVVLLIDDQIDFLTNIKNRLEGEGYHVIMALHLYKGFELFYAMKPNFVLMNIDIHEVTIEDLEGFTKAVNLSHTPIAFVSEETSLEGRVLAYEMGATDYVAKKIFSPDWFVPYLKTRLMHQQKVLVDELTGAYNRKYMTHILDELIADYERHGDTFSIVMIDLDHFKHINDTYGHLIGDLILRELVQTIQLHKRKTDDVCRYGGEEFQLILPRTNEEGALLLVERIREAFARKTFEADGESFKVTFSAGIVVGHESNLSQEQLIYQADQALYQSKASGRNQIRMYSKRIDQTVVSHLHVVIIDDNRLIRTMLEQSFLQWTVDSSIKTHVHTYTDGVTFLNSDWCVPGEKYIILLDGMMPEMDGKDVLAQIRKDYPEENIVISMLSARSCETSIVQALEEGADDYMLKPFKIPEVLSRMKRLVERMLF